MRAVPSSGRAPGSESATGFSLPRNHALGVKSSGDCETLIVNGVEDHVHALFALSRTHPIASVVKEIKRRSSGWVKELSPKLAKFHSQGGYGAFSLSQSNLEEVTRYIERQEEHHRRVTFQEEYRAFLKAYGIAYDERYVGLTRSVRQFQNPNAEGVRQFQPRGCALATLGATHRYKDPTLKELRRRSAGYGKTVATPSELWKDLVRYP